MSSDAGPERRISQDIRSAELAAALNQFRLDWQQSICLLPVDALTQERIDHLLDLAKALVRKTDDLIQAETSQWISEFRETLTEIERSAQAKGE